MKRKLSLLLVLYMMLSAFVSCSEDQNDVDGKCRNGEESGETVVDHHEERNGDQRENSNPDTVGNIAGSEFGIGVEHGVDFDLEGETSAHESVCNGFSVSYLGEMVRREIKS